MAEKLIAAKTVEERVAAPIDSVWALLSDFSSITRRAPSIVDFAIEGSGVGSVRSFRIGDGPLLREQIEILDPANYYFSYALLPPAFMDDHLGEIQVRPDGPESCIVAWSGRCSVQSEDEATQRRQAFETTFKNGIAWVRKELGLS